jgi:hypothetical protein
MVNTIDPSFVPKSFFNTQTGELKVDKKLAEEVQAGVLGAVANMPDAQKAAFLGMVADLAPGSVDTPEELGAQLGAFEAASKLVDDGSNAPVMAFVGDIAKILARAMLEQSASERKNALEGRLAAREQAAAESLQQADKLKEAADKMMSGALTSLIVGIVSAAVSIVGSGISGFASLGAMSKLSGLAKNANSAFKAESFTKAMEFAKAGEFTKATQVMKTADIGFKELDDAQKIVMQKINLAAEAMTSLGRVATGLGDMGRAGAQGADAKAQAEAKTIEADASLDAAQSQYSQQTMEMRKEVQDSMKEFAEKIVEFIRQLQDAEVDAMRAITKG